MMVEYAGQDLKMEVKVIEDGWWAIDKIAEKKLMAICLVNKEHGLKYLTYVPTTADIVKIIEVYLECEKRNDEYEFPNGSTRPTELHKKIKELKGPIAKHEPIRMDEFY